MNREIADNGTATIEELIETSLDMGVDLQACEMTTELFDYAHEEFYRRSRPSASGLDPE